MSYKKLFLKLPLNTQLSISIFLLVITTIFLILFISEVVSSIFIHYLIQTRKKYFFDMQQNIIESNIFFMNIYLFQYEDLNKLFNYQYYLIVKDDSIIRDFIFPNIKYIYEDRMIILNKYEIYKIPTTKYNASEYNKKLYVFYYSELNTTLIEQIKFTCSTFLNQIINIENLRIPFYGNIALLQDYVIGFTKYKSLISFNYTSIFQDYQKSNGNMENGLLNFLIRIRNLNYNSNKKFFEDYENSLLHFIDIMYSLKYEIFYNYTLIKDKSSKENYIRNQAIYFQTILYDSDSTTFHDSWLTSDPRIQGHSTLIKGFVDFLLFRLSFIIDTYSIPFLHESSAILSKNLCYFFLLKQIINLNITTDKIINEFNNSFLDKIYEEINKQNINNIKYCKLETYYSKNIGKQINENNTFSDHYSLEYIYNNLIYLLRDKDINSIIFETKYSYPNLLTLKNMFPNYFSFRQLDFYSFSFGNTITKMIESSKQFYNNIRYLIIILLNFIWIIFIIITFIISSRTIKQITQPLINLIEIINLNNLNENNIDENDIFEYKLDDDINEFFLLCKRIINGEIQDYIYKKNGNIQIKDINNNMIINNKMILELIENQQSLNNDDNKIYLFNQRNTNKIRKRNLRKNNSSSNCNKDASSQGLDLIKLNSVTNKESNSSKDLYSNVEDNNPESNNMKCYENLLNLADFVYDWRDKEKTNKRNNLRVNVNKSSISTKNTNFIKLKSTSNISVKDKNEKENNTKKQCKYVTYSWYANAKQNKLFVNN